VALAIRRAFLLLKETMVDKAQITLRQIMALVAVVVRLL